MPSSTAGTKNNPSTYRKLALIRSSWLCCSQGAITVDLCRELIDESLLVSEDEIADAMREYIDAHHQLIEGSAAVALAALKRERERFAGQKTAVVICGGNVGREKLLSVLATN